MPEPSEVAARSFSTVRRGYDPNEVRAYLQVLAADLQRSRDEVAELRGRIDALAATPPTIDIDDDTLFARLGEESARVLTTARQAAAEMRAKGEDHLARSLREAEDETARRRAELDIEVAQRRDEAERDAAEIIEGAKAEGRTLLIEAQKLREQVLADLARRRDAGRRQIEQLRVGRDRLLHAFEAARITLGDITDDLERALPEANAAADQVVVEPEPAPEPDISALPAGELDTAAPTAEPSEPGAESVTVIGEVATGADAPYDVDADDALAPPGDGPTVDDLFARLRAEREAKVAVAREVLADDEPSEPVVDDDGIVVDLTPGTDPAVTHDLRDDDTGGDDTDDESEPAEVDPIVVAANLRDDATAPIARELARSLKRALADEQNEVLDRMRRARTPDADALGDADERAGRFRDAARPLLERALHAGAAGAPVDGSALDAVLDDVSVMVAVPLHERLVAVVHDEHDVTEVSTQVSNTYREWKTQRLDAISADLVLSAHARGVFAAVPAGTCVRWAIDPHGTGCPDADDNVLAGDVMVGEAFPTGHLHPPAHAGCRCLLVPSDAG